MPTLTECMEEIRKLVKAKGHEDTLSSVQLKLLFAVCEIAEAVDAWKKWGWDGQYNIDKICREIIDSIFYLLDAYGIIKREFPDTPSPDDTFLQKLKYNWNRGWRYGRPDAGFSVSMTVPPATIQVGMMADEEETGDK